MQSVSKVTYQYTKIISIIYRYVSFETPCTYFLTDLAQKYHLTSYIAALLPWYQHCHVNAWFRLYSKS